MPIGGGGGRIPGGGGPLGPIILPGGSIGLPPRIPMCGPPGGGGRNPGGTGILMPPRGNGGLIRIANPNFNEICAI